MRVATYNVNGVNGRLPRLLEWLRETQPDVVCLQELKTDDTKFPVRALEEAGYGAIWHGLPGDSVDRGTAGTAKFASKRPRKT